ncbi:putative beta-glucosidase [Mycena metata]|uniref:Probable beta-glucosidase G n=1 Tax=Mycena metata TaxID=1033252 RepID=A0AAD7NTA5_9AGAR|nr:putative beta-glucosidase [Mycena metata]
MGKIVPTLLLLVHGALVWSYELRAESTSSFLVADGGSWTTGFAKAKALVAKMTIEEKVNITTGYTGNCVGFTGEVPRLNVTAVCLQDGPNGVRPARRVSQFPAGVTTAATWNRDLMAARGTALGQEFHDKGVNIWLGPVAGGPLGRSPFGGRNWEGFSPDSYLTGVASYLTVKNAQDQGVITCAKHYIGYEQETFRNPYNLTEVYSVFPPLVQTPISSNFDDKTAHEVYLWSFAEAVRAGTGAIMCSYNEVNQTHSCSDDATLNGLLKTELAFQGAVISDWGGTWDTESFALGGLDISMPGTGLNIPGSPFFGLFGAFYGAELVALVENGTVSEARLDDMVLRTLTPILQHQDPNTYPLPTINVNDLNKPTNNVRRDHYTLIRDIGEEALTLVKNTGGLPLPNPASMQSLAVIGEDASASPYGATSCGDTGTACQIENNGTMTIGGGSGWAYPPYTIDPLAAINAFVRADGPDINAHLENWDLAAAALQASRSETALVFINAYAQEGADRHNLTSFSNGDALVKPVAAVNNNTIVILHIPGPVIVEDWIDLENVTAVLIAHLPGQESGNSLVPVLWGQKSPSGKLPYTVAKDVSDWPPNNIVSDPVLAPQANFTEKLLIDYKWFDAKNITPRWEFGFGLSYTTFKFGELSLVKSFKADNTSVQPTAEPFVKAGDSGSSMYDVLYTASVRVTNTGKVQGAEVAQLYISFPTSEDEPPNLLRGFDKLDLAPGQSGTATFDLTRKDLSVWNVVDQRWEIPQGAFTLSAGASSRDLRAVSTHKFA